MLTQQPSIAFSGNIPAYYDTYLGPMFFEPYAIDMASRLGKLKPTSVLELASGTGRLTKLLPEVLPVNVSITASDINPAMVAYGQNRVKNKNVKWMEADAVTLPFSDETFDVVVAQFGVMFYSDRIRAFREAWRVLKPGGTFIFSCWDEIKNNPMAMITNGSLQHFFPVDTPAFYSVPFSYYDENLISSDLRESGFDDFRIELTALTGYSTSAAHAATGLIQGTPTVTAIEERDAEKLPLIMEHLENEITKKFGRVSMQVPLQARIVTAKKESI